MKKSLNLIYLSFILMVGLISAGQYCPIEIRNKTPLDLTRTVFNQYQMDWWWFPEKIAPNSTVICGVNPSSNIFIDEKLTSAHAFYEGTLPSIRYGDQYDRKFFLRISSDYIRKPYWQQGLRAEFLAEDQNFYQKSENLPIPKYFPFRECKFLMTLTMRPSRDLPFGRSLKDLGDSKAYNFGMNQDGIQYYKYEG